MPPVYHYEALQIFTTIIVYTPLCVVRTMCFLIPQLSVLQESAKFRSKVIPWGYGGLLYQIICGDG